MMTFKRQWAVVAIFVIGLSVGLAQNATQCEIPGECVDSVLVGAGYEGSYADCLVFCNTTEGAEWYTHYTNDSLCLCWADCVEIDNATCTDCFSGETSCIPPSCFVPGRCQGVFIDFGTEPSPNDCLANCKETEGCEWFTHDSFNDACYTYGTCSDIDESCATCVSGENECYPEEPQTSTPLPPGPSPERIQFLFAAGGPYEAEVVDLDGPLPDVCPEPLGGPVDVSRTAGVLLANGAPAFCGGIRGDGNARDECDRFDFVSEEWKTTKLPEPRSGDEAVEVSDRKWWLLGGDQDGSGSTWFLSDIDTFAPAPTLQQDMLSVFCAAHCPNISMTYVAATTDPFFGNEQLFSYNWTSASWSNIEDLKAEGVYSGARCACLGVSDVYFVGGGGTDLEERNDNVVIFDGQTFRKGADFKLPISDGQLLNYEDTLLYVGGLQEYDGDVASESIFVLDGDNWFQQTRSMVNPRSNFAAVILGGNTPMECEMPATLPPPAHRAP